MKRRYEADVSSRWRSRFGRYGYRMVTGMLRAEGWVVNHEAGGADLPREEGLKVPKKQPKRPALVDGRLIRIRLRPLYRHHVWAYDFVADRTHDGRPLKDADGVGCDTAGTCHGECVALRAGRGFRGDDVVRILTEACKQRGGVLPEVISVDNGTEFTSRALDHWAYWNKVKLDFSRPGKPTDNAYIEAFNSILRREVLIAGDLAYSIWRRPKARSGEQWRRGVQHHPTTWELAPFYTDGLRPPKRPTAQDPGSA